MADIFRMIEYWSIPFQLPSSPGPACNTAMTIAGLLEQERIEHDGFRTAVFQAVWQNQRDDGEYYFGADRMEVLATRLPA